MDDRELDFRLKYLENGIKEILSLLQPNLDEMEEYFKKDEKRHFKRKQEE